MKMSKSVKVGLGVVVFCLVISMFACSDKSAEIGNTVDNELAEQYPDKAVDPPVTEEEPVEEEPIEDEYVEPSIEQNGNFESAKNMIDDICSSALPTDGSIEYTSYYDEEGKVLALGFKVNLLDSTQFTQQDIDNMLAEYNIVGIYADLNDQSEELLKSFGIYDVSVESCIFDVNLIPIKYIY